MNIYYKPMKKLKVNTVEIVWRNNIKQITEMQNNGELWEAKLNLTKGEYHYRFFINRMVLLNDPSANSYITDDNNMIWSILSIGKDGDKINSSIHNAIILDNYLISNRKIEENEINPVKKNIFNTFMDDMVSFRFDFSDVTGIHTVTLLWCSLYGDIIYVSENNVFSDYKNIYVWFSVKLENFHINGNWMIQLYINGENILEEYVSIGQIAFYDNRGKNVIDGL